jgi:hypothetical protein
MGDQLVSRPLSIHIATKTHNKDIQTYLDRDSYQGPPHSMRLYAVSSATGLSLLQFAIVIKFTLKMFARNSYLEGEEDRLIFSWKK